MTARTFLVALACALLPAASSPVVERPAARSAVTMLVRPAVAPARALRRVAAAVFSWTGGGVADSSTPAAPPSRARVRERLFLWWCALLR